MTLGEVAEVYKAAPVRPCVAVAEHFGVRKRTAENLVYRARKAGLLEPTTQGRTGKVPHCPTCGQVWR